LIFGYENKQTSKQANKQTIKQSNKQQIKTETDNIIFINEQNEENLFQFFFT